MKKLIAALFLVSTAVQANPIDDKCGQFALFGAPDGKVAAQDQFLCKQNYAILHSCDKKEPLFVVEHPTKAAVTGPAKRKDDFRPDPQVTAGCQAQLADYATAGKIYDRGHMVPAGDNTQNDSIMSESFFLSNMVPQIANNNRGIWKQLETQVRNWVVAGRDVYVVSGPIFDQGYKAIGKNNVAVPTRLFKVIVDKTNGKMIAFIFPNAPLPVNDLPKYVVSVAAVEQATGFNFNPKIPAQFAPLEAQVTQLQGF